MAPLSLLERLQQLPDPRDPRGCIHPLPSILALTTVAILAGNTSLEAIAQFGRDHGPALAFALGFRRAKTPAKSTFSELFRLLDAAAFEALLAAWARDHHAEAGEVIAIDGKVLKGSRDGQAPGLHLLSAFVPKTKAVLAQLPVEASTNEHKAALRLLGILPLAGQVVTGDAMFTHRDVAQAIRDGGGDYLLVVKDNQPELKAAIASAWHDDADFSPLPTASEGRGGAAGPDFGQRARPDRASPSAEHDGVERGAGRAGRRPGVRAGADADDPEQDECGGGVRDNEPGAGCGGRGAFVAVSA
jgi:hypothetical protein